MAGLGTRFKQEGFDLPKPLIEVNEKTLIEHSIESLGIEGKYIFITRKYENPEHNILLSAKLKELRPESVEIKISHTTSGATETCLYARELINNFEDLIITNCDQRLEWDANKFKEFIKNTNCCGAVVTHYSKNSKHSYAVTDANDNILSLHEKNPISTDALIGVHYWRCGSDFVDSAESLLLNFQSESKPECYISETYNYLIKEKRNIMIFRIPVNEYIPLGTPYDLNVYKGKVKEFQTDKPKSIFCDIDGTILMHAHKFSELNKNEQILLDNVREKFDEWDSHGHKIILCTARKESARRMTEGHLSSLGISWDALIMGLTSGERILINDKLNFKTKDRARAVNIITNEGFKSVDWQQYSL